MFLDRQLYTTKNFDFKTKVECFSELFSKHCSSMQLDRILASLSKVNSELLNER